MRKREEAVAEANDSIWTKNRWAVTDSKIPSNANEYKEPYVRIYESVRKQLEQIEDCAGKTESELQFEKELYLADRIVNASKNIYMQTVRKVIEILLAIIAVADAVRSVCLLINPNMEADYFDLISILIIVVLIVILFLLERKVSQKEQDRLIALEALNYYRIKNQEGEIFRQTANKKV